MSSWFKFENKADEGAVLYLYDEIGGYGIDALQFVAELNAIEADEITVHINSVGGEVFQGFAIYQALKDHPANVHVIVDALAASIASVIAMAGDKVTMSRNAEMMIHDGMVTAAGNAAALTEMVAMLERVSNNIASVYAERVGGDVAEWRNAMRKETWYNAEEAVAAGLADEVAPAAKRAARNVADLRVFNYAGRAFAPSPVIPEKVEPEFVWDVEAVVKALKESFGE